MPIDKETPHSNKTRQPTSWRTQSFCAATLRTLTGKYCWLTTGILVLSRISRGIAGCRKDAHKELSPIACRRRLKSAGKQREFWDQLGRHNADVPSTGSSIKVVDTVAHSRPQILWARDYPFFFLNSLRKCFVESLKLNVVLKVSVCDRLSKNLKSFSIKVSAGFQRHYYSATIAATAFRALGVYPEKTAPQWIEPGSMAS